MPASRCFRWRRSLVTCNEYSTAVQFYQNKQLEIYAAKATNRLTLRQLVFFGRSMDEERLIKSANYVRTELPIRIAHRLRDLQALPYIVVTQDNMAKVYELYWTAFDKFRRFPFIRTIEDNERFCSFCKSLLNEHVAVIPHLALGMTLSSPHLDPENLDSFMRRMLVSRISRRVLVEHHIALTEALHTSGSRSNDGVQNVGIIYTDLDPIKTLKQCATLLRENPRSITEGSHEPIASHDLPEILIDGQANVRFAYIQKHLEYIVYELLKNAARATTLQHRARGRTGSPPSIRVTVVAGPHDIDIRFSDQGGGIEVPNLQTTADLFSFSHTRNSSRLESGTLLALQSASSRRQGLKGTVEEQVAKNDKEEAEEQATHPHLGIGLPMSNIYATYFGGALQIVSMNGWGTDVYLKLPKLGTNLEGIEV